MPFFPLFVVRPIASLRRKKMYATWHEVWGKEYWSTYLGASGILGAFTEWGAMKLPHVIISNSDHTTKRLKASNCKKQIVTVPLGVDVENILMLPVHDLESDIIFAGRLLKNKNVDLLIEAVAKVKRTKADVRCLIIGVGPERKNLERLVSERGLKNNVTFLNFLEDHNELYSLMKASKMFVLASVREGFGLVVVEANACGIPVITTTHEHNAAQDLIKEGQNGYLTKPNAAALATQIRRILKEGKKLTPRRTLEGRFKTYRWSHAAKTVEKELAQ
jgi:glycosyltransferase involved in cell wall biosynthesis